MKTILSTALVALTLATSIATATSSAHALDAKKFFTEQQASG